MSETKILLNLTNHGWNRIMTSELYRQLSELGSLQRFNMDEGGTHDDFLQAVAASDIMITSWGSEPLLDTDLGKTGRLKLVLHGAGTMRPIITENIIRSGVRVTQGAGQIAKAVAQYTVGLIVLALRDSVARYLFMREGKRIDRPTHDLEGLTVGLVSLSQVGRQVPALLQPFGARVLAYDPYWQPAQARSLGVELVTLEELITRSDVVSLHAPVLEETKNMINADLVGKMKPGAAFINTARGILVDQDALFARCYKGEITAYLDVTTPEPLPKDHPAWQCPYVFITPHIAGVTQESIRRIGAAIVRNIRNFQAGQPLEGEVTAERYAILA
jgi:phosphoglycerate dehydrogenase-like enzyme